MKNIEKYRIIHDQFSFSKAVTIELFELGDKINLSSGGEREKYLSEVRSLLVTYKMPLQDLAILFSYIRILNINLDNYDLFMSGDELEDHIFESKTYDAEKERKGGNRLTTIVISSFLLCVVAFFFLFKSCGDKNTEEKVVQKSTCECVKWGEKYNVINERELIQNGTSAEMKEFEDGKKEWNNACFDLLNPTVMSEKMKMLEELEKCK